jgi:Transcriptional regulator, AbiEi antitoxin, Type IV TA system
MLKEPQISGKELEKRAIEHMRHLLAPLPLAAKNLQVEEQPRLGSLRPDFLINLGSGNEGWTLVCEVKSDGQPKNIRYAALQVRDYMNRGPKNQHMYPVVIAPYISPASQAICREMEVGYADLAGNSHLAFGDIYVDRQVAENPFHRRREQRSLFSPKSARVLRVLLTDPLRPWKVEDLARRSRVSLGQVSNVKRMLVDREFGVAKRGDVWIASPYRLLEEWESAYVPPRSARQLYYTALHGQKLQAAIEEAFVANGLAKALSDELPKLLLSSFSAARWVAPYARVAGEYFYADEESEKDLANHLKLEHVSRGENVVVDRPKDDGVYLESTEPKKGLRSTGLIQTYLDLHATGERGREAAVHFRELAIDPVWKGLK